MEKALWPSSLFHLFTITLLSLLLPLSFLLLARLSSAQYLFSLLPNSSPPPFFLSLILLINPSLLLLLVSSIAIFSLFQILTKNSPLPKNLPNPISHSRLYCAWILLCTLQVCVGVGIEGSLSIGLNEASSFGINGGVWRRGLFLVGLHGIVVYWCREVVKPVVDDTVFGEVRKERWFEKVAMAVSLGVLWWWKLREEMEALVGFGGFSGWCLYYITVAIGVVKIVKGFAWIGGVLICKMRSKSSSATVFEVEDKV